MNRNDELAELHQKKILIVEDERSNYELLKAILRNTKAEIFWAHNGKEAIEFCDNNNFNLVLMDIKMPEMNGYEAVTILRQKGHTFPIIAQTAYALVEDEAIILKKGFDGYISKPIDRKRLFDYVEKYLNI
jgi:CheY-like chemotaxis protein